MPPVMITCVTPMAITPVMATCRMMMSRRCWLNRPEAFVAHVEQEAAADRCGSSSFEDDGDDDKRQKHAELGSRIRSALGVECQATDAVGGVCFACYFSPSRGRSAPFTGHCRDGMRLPLPRMAERRRATPPPCSIEGQFFFKNWSMLAGVTSWKGI